MEAFSKDVHEVNTMKAHDVRVLEARAVSLRRLVDGPTAAAASLRLLALKPLRTFMPEDDTPDIEFRLRGAFFPDGT